MKKIENFTLHNRRGQCVLMRDLGKWKDPSVRDAIIFGPVVRYSWMFDGVEYEKSDEAHRISMRELPGGDGFICFEAGWKPDNCLLIDVFGRERMRLTVPWQLTTPRNPESANPPTSFARISEPCINPIDGKRGIFGVEAWVELAGQYYFELDYRMGCFLWGKEIRD